MERDNIFEASTPFRDGLRRFRSNGLAMTGVAGIAFLLFVSIAAPLIANARPLLLYKDGGLWSPAARYLFAPDSAEVFVERFFNYLLILFPFTVVFWFLKRIRVCRAWLALAIPAVLLLLPFFLTQSRLDKRDWREIRGNLPPGEFAIFALVPYGPFENVAAPYEKPSRKHIFGTDKIGRDVLSRMIYGSRVSLAVGLFATGAAMLIGIVVGLCSGYFGGVTDMLMMRVVEIVICFPTFLLLLILMSILMDYKFTQSILLVIGVIGLTGWTGLARIVRGETLKLRELPFIRACETLAVPVWRILLRHLLPNVMGVVTISFTFGIAGAILAESSLSFLGFGVQDPTASWGEL
ncbi:MAG: ABC transporter permease, partial [Kiritimatiellaeota bacterium]|nr:ABC transporter permease [Kiritimatiellota bacterium]